ncbi:MAG TPA: tyrosine-type recombinase/integrase [Dehalococcoidia bacterium]|nr:tyrosine-type recombinase/integrase [Dehalococcoidia bacterium]
MDVGVDPEPLRSDFGRRYVSPEVDRDNWGVPYPVRPRANAPRPRRRPDWADSVPGPRDPLPDQVEQFLEYLRIQRNRPSTTLRNYRQDLAKFVAFMRTVPLGATFTAPIDRDVLRRYQVQLADALPHPRSRTRVLVSLRRFLAYAYDEGWIDRDLSRVVTLPAFVIGDPHPIPTELVPVMLESLPRTTLRDQRDRALLHFLISTGCRIGEACAVDRDEVKRDGFRVLGKGGKYRTVFLTQAAYDAVHEYLDRRGPDDSPALFISVSRAELVRGQPMPHNRLTPGGAREALAALRRRMSSDRQLAGAFRHLRSPHAARHTAATTLLEATDGDVRLVQEVLGHATLETLRVYTEITDRRKRAAYKRLGEYLAKAADTEPAAG